MNEKQPSKVDRLLNRLPSYREIIGDNKLEVSANGMPRLKDVREMRESEVKHMGYVEKRKWF